jgi:DNA-binding HxlR family transcriptional regulator
MSRVAPEINRRIRIAMLELLKTQYPGSLDFKVLRFSLDNLGYPLMEEDLSAHLRYLEEKGFLHCESRKRYGFDISFCRLTAAGWDLIDGHIREKGIDEAL